MIDGDDAPDLVVDRECGECGLCCKVFPVPEIGKDDYLDCRYLRPGSGCGIHADRPPTCREFFCIWRLDASLDDEWKPSVAGFVLHDPSPWELLVSVDPTTPDAWRREPYYSQIREWAIELGRRQHLVGVRVGDRTSLLLKDGEVDIDFGARS